MRLIQTTCLLTLPLLIALPGGALRGQDASPAPLVASVVPSAPAPDAAARLPDFSPQAIRKARAQLYLEGAREPLAKLAPQIYAFASDSERCRLNSAARACDLPSEPLKGSGLKQIFKYYIKGPVEAVLAQQRLDIQKSDWTWQPYVSRRNP